MWVLDCDRYVKGKLERFEVEPAGRKSAVSFANCVNGTGVGDTARV